MKYSLRKVCQNAGFRQPVSSRITAQKIKFSIKYFFSKCDQICRKQRVWSHLLKKSLMENLIFCAVKNCGTNSFKVNLFLQLLL